MSAINKIINPNACSGYSQSQPTVNRGLGLNRGLKFEKPILLNHFNGLFLIAIHQSYSICRIHSIKSGYMLSGRRKKDIH